MEPFVLRAAIARRVFGAGMLGLLGLLLIWLGIEARPAFGWMLVLVGFGIATLWMMRRLWRASAGEVVMTEAGLFDQDGRVLALMEDIDGIDRGMMALKPSNGFVLRLKTRAKPGWAPGLWWRTGRRLGVGGVTSAGASKAMADILALRLQGRDLPS